MAASGIGQFIREARLKKRLSQRELAKLVPMSDGFLSGIENGKRNPPPAILKKLAKALDISSREISDRDVRPALKDLRRILADEPELNFEFIKTVKRLKRGEISPKALLNQLSALNGETVRRG